MSAAVRSIETLRKTVCAPGPPGVYGGSPTEARGASSVTTDHFGMLLDTIRIEQRSGPPRRGSMHIAPGRMAGDGPTSQQDLGLAPRGHCHRNLVHVQRMAVDVPAVRIGDCPSGRMAARHHRWANGEWVLAAFILFGAGALIDGVWRSHHARTSASGD
jgi:hypothetical protein